MNRGPAARHACIDSMLASAAVATLLRSSYGVVLGRFSNSGFVVTVCSGARCFRGSLLRCVQGLLRCVQGPVATDAYDV